MICPLAPSIDFLFPKFIQSFTNNKKAIREMRFVCDEYAVQSAVARETDKTTVTFVITYSTRGVVLKLCTMPDNVAR